MTNKPATTKQNMPTPEETFNSIFEVHGHQKEVLLQEYMKARAKAAEDFNQELSEEPEFDIAALLASDDSKRKAAAKLAEDAVSPIVSRETQIAVLKQLIQDFFRGKKRVGLSALTMLRAVELLNKMTGYEAPQKIEVDVDHKVNVLPVIGQPFQGELEPLKVVDIQDETTGVIEVVAEAPTNPTPELPPPPPTEPTSDNVKAEELFP